MATLDDPLLLDELSSADVATLRTVLRTLPQLATVEDILLLPPSVLPSQAITSGLLHRLASHLLNRNKRLATDAFLGFVGTSYDLLSRQLYLGVGDEVLDRFLSPGIAASGINELSGVSGSGKTQFCLQLALTVQLPLAHGGLEGGCMYITTESRLPVERLAQMASRFAIYTPPGHRFLDNIIVEPIHDAETLLHMLSYAFAEKVLAFGRIRLIIIDSIAALFRGESESQDIRSRNKMLHTIGSTLKKLADAYCLAVVVVNQVSARISDDYNNYNRINNHNTMLQGIDQFDMDINLSKCARNYRNSVPCSKQAYPPVISALGQTWASCVNTRLMLARHDRFDGGSTVPLSTMGTTNGNESSCLRTLHIVFSQYLKSSLGREAGPYCTVSVALDGLRGVQMISPAVS